MYSGGALAANLLRGVGGAPPAADITISVAKFSSGTTTGVEQTYHTSTLTGLTPAALLFFASGHRTTDGATERATGSLGFGMHVGTGRRTLSYISGDNLTSTDTRTYSSDIASLALAFIGGTSANLSTTNDTAIPESGGAAITWSQAAADYNFNYVAFAGTDVANATVGEQDLGSTTSPVSVNLGFRPDVVIFMEKCNANTFSPGQDFNIQVSHGIAIWNGASTEQRALLMAELRSNAAGGIPFQAILTDAAAGQINASTGAIDYETSCSITATGFDLTTTASSTDNVAYLALKFNGANLALIDFDTPTTTGAHNVTGVGFTPHTALAFVTNLQVVDPSSPLTSSDDMGGLAVCCIGSDEQYSFAIRINSGSDPSDTGTFSGAHSMIQPSATNCKAGLAMFGAWNSDGWSQTWSAVQGSARKGFALAIG